MAAGPRIKPVLSRLALIGGMVTAMAAATANPAAAINQPWKVEVLVPRKLATGCAAVIAQTARDAVRRCLAKVGVAGTMLPLEDFAVTAGPVCKTTHVVTSNLTPTLIGYVYSNKLSPILRPSCR